MYYKQTNLTRNLQSCTRRRLTTQSRVQITYLSPQYYLTTITLITDLETTAGNYDSFGFGKPCHKGMVAVQKPEGTKCFPDPGKRSSWQHMSNDNLIGRLVLVIIIINKK